MADAFINRLRKTSTLSWTNWAGNQHCTPSAIERPLTEAAVQGIVKRAAAAGQQVRAVGSGHSFTAIACTNQVLISLEHLNMVRKIDKKNNRVTVQGGIELAHLNSRLAKAGLAMTNLGDIAYQTIAGATSTSTHGTGVNFGGLATQILSMRIVTATGATVTASADENPELFRCARVGLGVFGVIVEVTLQVEPAFNLAAIERPRPLDDVLDNWMVDIRAHDHYEFFWIPGTDQAMTKANRRTDEPARPLSRPKHFVEKVLAENVGFGAMAKIAKLRPSLVPKLRDFVVGALSETEFSDASHKVFASARWVKFVEMEYSVAVADVPTVLRRIDQAVADAGLELLFPVEVRAAAGDDIPLSTSNGRESGYIAVHRAKGAAYRPYFELVEAIMDDFDGRPHWGKLHFQTAATLASRYRHWDDFQRVRADYDPQGLFSNDYIDRVLGPVHQRS